MKKSCFLWLAFIVLAFPMKSQILQDIKNAKDKLAKVTVDKLSIDPVTTSFKDVEVKTITDEEFDHGKIYLSIHEQPISSDSCFLLKPGFYEGYFESFCIKSGTYAPTKGNGRFYSELKGPKADIVETIIRGHQSRADISQRDTQLLLWAIIAKTDFQKMKGSIKATAVKLLSPKQLVRLSKGSLDNFSKKQMAKLKTKNNGLRTVLEAENKLRSMYYEGLDTYEDYESVAILAGVEPITPDYEAGKWILHPDGYYIRYYMNGYTQTHTQIYVPEGLLEVCFDGIGDIGVPANTWAQRILQTNIPYGEGVWNMTQSINTDSDTEDE